jgi:hypothetical protein
MTREPFRSFKATPLKTTHVYGATFNVRKHYYFVYDGVKDLAYAEHWDTDLDTFLRYFKPIDRTTPDELTSLRKKTHARPKKIFDHLPKRREPLTRQQLQDYTLVNLLRHRFIPYAKSVYPTWSLPDDDEVSYDTFNEVRTMEFVYMVRNYSLKGTKIDKIILDLYTKKYKEKTFKKFAL